MLRILTALTVTILSFLAIQPAPIHHASLVVILTSNNGVVLASESMGVASDGTAEVYTQQKIFPISAKSALVITGVSGYPSDTGTVWLQDAITKFVVINRNRLISAELEKQTQMVSDFVVEFLRKNFLTIPATLLPRTNRPIVMFVIVRHDVVHEKQALRLHRFWYSKRNREVRVEVRTSPVVRDRSTVVAFGSGGRAFDTIFQQLFFGEERKYQKLRRLAVVQRIKKATRTPSINSIYVPLSDGPELCRTIIDYAIDHWKEYEEGRQTIGGPVKIAIITPQHGFQWVN